MVRAKEKPPEVKRRAEEPRKFKSLSDELSHSRNQSGSGGLSGLADQLQKDLESGHRTRCLRTMATMMEMGAEIKDGDAGQMLEQAALRPGAMQFAMIMWLVSTGKSVTLGVEVFLRGLGSLIQQGAPAQLIRLWLNLGVPIRSPALTPLPEGFDRQEREEAERELEAASGVVSEDEEDAPRGRAPSRYLSFEGCLARPELNGRYQLSQELTCHHRPVYEKLVEQQRGTEERASGKGGKGRGAGGRGPSSGAFADDVEDAGQRQDVIVISWKKDKGWYFTRKTCGGEELAWNGRSSKTPPTAGWLLLRKSAGSQGSSRHPDPLRVVDAARGSGAGGGEAMQILSQIDVQKLRGRLVAPDRNEYAVEYFGHFCALMHLEHLEERRQLQRRAQRSGPLLDNLECAGVFGRKDGRKADALGWEDPGSEMGMLLLPSSTSLERLRVKKGDSVSLSEAGLGAKLAGTVADLKPARGREPAQMIVKVRGAWPDNAQTGAWRVDQDANGTLYERQLQALLSLVAKPRNKVCELLIAARVGGVDAWVARSRGKTGGGQTPVTKTRAKDQAAARKLASTQPHAQKLDEALDSVATLSHLNASQREAVSAALKQTCAVIQGPPGTGKTHVSVQILKMWARSLGLSPLLATSDSNVAVDNIAMGLQAQGVKVLRVGRPEKVNKIIEEITLETALEKELALAERELRKAEEQECQDETRPHSASPERVEESKDGKGKGKDKGKGKSKSKGLTPKARYELQMKVLRSAEVICCTSIAAGGDFFSKFSFAGVLVDEAAQATELSAVVPLILRGTQRLVLVGDHCQLPPTVQSSEAEARGLSVSLYSRMIDGGGLSPYLLDTQYRSHPLLAAFSARAFYQGRLQSGIAADKRPPPLGPSWPREGVPLAFKEVEAEEQQDGDSKMNPGEADVIVDLLKDVLAKGELEVTDIGVVTPYLAQVRCLRRVARDVVPRGTDPSLLEIASVDNFQGREKELIIFSAVRSNRSGNIGFLADWRRLNVMLTRARRGLVICGNARTLRTNEHWSAWLEFHRCAAAGKPLPRTPSPERRRRAEEAEAEQQRLRKELEAAEAEAEAEARAAERERRKRPRSPSRRRSPGRRRSPPQAQRAPRRVGSGISRKSTEERGWSDDEALWGLELTSGGDAAGGRSDSPSPAADPPPAGEMKAASSAAVDALARAWANSGIQRPSAPPPKKEESSSECELLLDSD